MSHLAGQAHRRFDVVNWPSTGSARGYDLFDGSGQQVDGGADGGDAVAGEFLHLPTVAEYRRSMAPAPRPPINATAIAPSLPPPGAGLEVLRQLRGLLDHDDPVGVAQAVNCLGKPIGDVRGLVGGAANERPHRATVHSGQLPQPKKGRHDRSRLHAQARFGLYPNVLGNAMLRQARLVTLVGQRRTHGPEAGHPGAIVHSGLRLSG